MNTPAKEELSTQLKSMFAEIISWFEAQPEASFNTVIVKGKWTMAGHLYHLIKSTKGVSRGIQMPKLALQVAFGKSNRTERTFEQQHQRYIKALGDFTTANGFPPTPSSDFVPSEGRQFEKQALLDRFIEEGEHYCQALKKWKEKDMSVYVLPHPIMGKLTIREFTYFTIFHAQHHLDILISNYQEK